MFEEMTYEKIMNDALKKVPSDVDKRQGAVIYDALAPICAELAQYYIGLDLVIKETFADTASRKYLIKRAAERGIKPYQATKSIILAELKGNIKIQGGERLNLDDINFVCTGEKEGNYYKLECETAGTIGNVTYGDLIPIDNIPGLEKAEVAGLFTAARDDEETEVFRKRYFASFENQAFGGNRADYMEKISALNELTEVSGNGGIGGIKVYRVPNGGGTVKAVFTSSAYRAPSDTLINIVQTAIDPETNHGEGMGFAPIGHTVTVLGVNETKINIGLEIALKEGYVLEDVKGYINNAVDEYLDELCREWAENDSLIVRISYIDSAVLSVKGVLDIISTSINGVQKNFELDEYSIPVRGDISVN